MKRFLFIMVYWLSGLVLLSLILLSTKYSFGQALLTSCALLPGTLLAKYLGRDISFSHRREGLRNAVYLALAVLLTTWLSILCIHWYLLKTDAEDILLNPVFILLIISFYGGINFYLENKLFHRPKEPEKFIDFISDRKKVRLELDSIIYIESNNNEVWIHTRPSDAAATTGYRTKMKISRWEEILDDRFQRVHRSFIVNKKHIGCTGATHLLMDDGAEIEISRKHRRQLP